MERPDSFLADLYRQEYPTLFRVACRARLSQLLKKCRGLMGPEVAPEKDVSNDVTIPSPHDMDIMISLISKLAL